MSYSGVEPSGNVAADESADRGTSIIDRHSEIDGTYNTSRDLRIEGLLTGSVNCDGVLFIADGAIVDATVDAASVIVSGQLSGNIRCRGRLEITASGSVGGEVETAALVIVEGARYEGQIKMTGISMETSGQPVATPAAQDDTVSDAHSLLRRFTSTPPVESRDESPAATFDEDEDDEG
ncbi:MAG: polymer-forming cytoskeletal protein [Chloroflexia bacterium]|nr:polymer-forming cytoskeletal protein [Chloroflexia bacterium]